MTKKDFEVVAAIIALLPEPVQANKEKINWILTGLNPRFNSKKFWDYVENKR